eukprot:1253148-Pleurochrysis_carterae.AAC.1
MRDHRCSARRYMCARSSDGSSAQNAALININTGKSGTRDSISGSYWPPRCVRRQRVVVSACVEQLSEERREGGG